MCDLILSKQKCLPHTKSDFKKHVFFTFPSIAYKNHYFAIFSEAATDLFNEYKTDWKERDVKKILLEFRYYFKNGKKIVILRLIKFDLKYC